MRIGPKHVLWLLFVAVCLPLTGSAMAQRPSAQRQGVDRWILAQWEEADKDADGRVTAAEFGGSKKVFDLHDWDGNGYISRDELPHQRSRQALVLVHRNLKQESVLAQDVVFGKGGNRALKLDYLHLKNAPKPMPVLVWIHGGAWQQGERLNGADLLLPFARRGFFCVTIDYRLSHEDPFPAQIEDCKCAIRYLRAHARKLGINPNKIGVWGSSAGGHLAALLGVTGDVKELEGQGGWGKQSSKVAAVCDWYGPTDLRSDKHLNDPAVKKLLGNAGRDRAKLAALASPISHVSADDPPFVVVHGTDDPVVPYDQSVKFSEALEAAGVPVHFIRVKHGEHGGKMFRKSKIRKNIYYFFMKHLG